MTEAEQIDAFIKSGRATLCPPAFVAETHQARDLTAAERALLQPKPRVDAKATWNTLGGLTARKAPTPPVDVPDIHVGDMPKEPSRPMPYLGESEVTTRIFSNGRREVTTIDHQGRWFVSRFGPARNGLSNYQGTVWVNRAAFEAHDVK